MSKLSKSIKDLNEADLKFFSMTNEEFDERANRLAYKSLNGIVDEEVIEATNRVYKTLRLFLGRKIADKIIAEDKELLKHINSN
jgi:hypothetical protein